jgi:hypothetical protein
VRTLKQPTACLDAARVGTPRSAYDPTGSAAMCALGDSSGGVHALDLDGEIDGPPRWRPFVPRAVPHASRALCALVLLNDDSGERRGPRTHGGGGGGGGGGDGGGGMVLAGAMDEAEESEEEVEEEEEAGTAGRAARASDGDGDGVRFAVASAHRDGMVCVSSYDTQGGRQLRFAASLRLDTDGALTCERSRTTIEPPSLPPRGDELPPSLPSRGDDLPPSLPSRADMLPPS